MVLVRVRVRVARVRVFICPSEPSRERVKVSHVIVECRVINHHPGRLGADIVDQVYTIPNAWPSARAIKGLLHAMETGFG